MEIHLKSRTVKYVSVTIAFLLVASFLLYLFNIDKAIESLREINYFDLLLGQIANTLIVLSLTSVLSSNFGQAYWVDIKETKLIKPFWSCFTGITVYLLTALLYSILMYAIGRYAGVLLSAVFSTVLLVILSFQMISIYFGKEGIKKQLREEYEQLLRLTNYPYVSDYLYKIKKLEKELRECASPEKEDLCRALQTEIRGLEKKLNSGDEKQVEEAHKEYVKRSVDAHETLKNIDRKLEEYTKETIIRNISFVFQDSKLFKKSIYDNVALADEKAGREEVMEALSLAGCDEIIAKFKDGEDTIIGSKGVYLSGGEKQRIAIARAILKKSPIVIMDEASAAIDADNEYELQKAFKNLMKDKTVIMIAHRMTSIRNVDEIIVLENGRIVERGDNDSLLSAQGLYSRLVNLYETANDWRVSNEKLL